MKTITLLMTLLTLTSCGVNTSGNINIDPSDIQIIRKNGLCFGFVASRKTMSMATTGLGLTYIPCEKLQ